MEWSVQKIHQRIRDCMFVSINSNRIYFSSFFTKEIIVKQCLFNVTFVQAGNFKYVGFDFSTNGSYLLHIKGGMAVVYCNSFIDTLNLDFNKQKTYQFLLSYDNDNHIWFFKLK